jgi:Na+/proline symporter
VAGAAYGGIWPWVLLAGYGVALIALAPAARDATEFYEGKDRLGRPPTLAFLCASLFIAWIFAKSVTNAANLGATYGLPGAVAYAAYWLSIPVAALVIVALRRRHGARSLPGWLVGRYGRGAAGAFLLAILIRLFNEVWSNTAVIGSYFGPKGSAAYYAAALGFTALTLAYTLKGGLRTSIWTDAIQAAVFAAFLVLVVALALPGATGGHAERVLTAGEWTLVGGVDLLLVALLQSLSYPFHDPVLTDRGFLTDTRTTLRAFGLAGAAGALAIALFGLVGVTAFVRGLPVADDAPRAVAASLGVGMLVMVNVVMLTSAGSTVDSAFSAVAKAVSVDAVGLAGRAARGLTVGRVAMIAAALLGSLPLFAGTAILKATTISGTMVLGLAPVFILGAFVRAPAASFHLAFWTWIACGTLDVLGLVPPALRIGGGAYATLLGVNVWGLGLATALFCLPVLWRRVRSAPQDDVSMI